MEIQKAAIYYASHKNDYKDYMKNIHRLYKEQFKLYGIDYECFVEEATLIMFRFHMTLEQVNDKVNGYKPIYNKYLNELLKCLPKVDDSLKYCIIWNSTVGYNKR